MSLADKIIKKYKEMFNEEPVLVKSPGRVNLIGEHTDYNMGFVLPAAINKAIYFAVAPRNDSKSVLFSYDMNEVFEFTNENLEMQNSSKLWPNYLMGVVDQLIKHGYMVKGFNCVFGGDIPIGAGLSSSAAIEAGLAFALNKIFNLGLDKLSLVKVAQKAENEFVGVNCGIMDQYINIFGKNGNAIRIDCRSLEYKYFPFSYKNISIVLFDTSISHSLASTEYNKRRKECNIGVKVIKKDNENIRSLRDVNMELLSSYESELNPVIYKRCKYVIEENNRLLDACDALSRHDLQAFGTLMYRTHEGLSKDYEVSCAALDYLVELTKDNPKVYGSRMMGGGFGGCTINLIENEAVDSISKFVMKEYNKKFGLEPKVYITKISGGTSLMEIEEDVSA